MLGKIIITIILVNINQKKIFLFLSYCRLINFKLLRIKEKINYNKRLLPILMLLYMLKCLRSFI